MADNKKFERKHFFIDRKLQGRYMISFLVPMLIMLLFMIFTLYFASKSLINTAASIVKDDIQNKITTQFQDNSEPSVASYKALIKEINIYIRNFSQNSKYHETVLTTLLYIFGIGILFVIVQLVLLTVFFSHKIAGPVYRFEIVCHNIIDGKYNDKIVLRKGDEMQNLAMLFNEVITKTKSRLTDLKNSKTNVEKEKIFESIEL